MLCMRAAVYPFVFLGLFTLCCIPQPAQSLPLTSLDYPASHAVPQADLLETLLGHDKSFPELLKNTTGTIVGNAQTVLNKYANVVYGVSIPIGVFACFLGYFLIKPFFFIFGFALGALILGILAYSLTLGKSYMAGVTISTTILGGTLTAFLALKMVALGVFCVGAALGFAITFAIKAPLLNKISPQKEQLVFYLVAAALAAVLGSFALCIQREMLILATSFAGSFGVVYGIAHFVGHFPPIFSSAGVTASKSNGWAWGYLVAFILFGIFGSVVQFKFTAKRKDVQMRTQERQTRQVQEQQGSVGLLHNR